MIDDFLVIQILCVFVFVLSLSTFLTKNYFSVVNFVFVGVYLPLFLFTLRWSEFIPDNLQFEFIYIFVCLTVLVFVYHFLFFRRTITKIEFLGVTKEGRYIVPFLNIAYIAAYLFENLYLSGFLIPSLHGIDIHVDGISIIRYLTVSMQVVLVANYLYYRVTKINAFLWLSFCVILIPVVTRGARIVTFQGIILLLMVFLWVDIYSGKNSSRVLKLCFEGVVFFLPLIVLFDFVTEYRGEVLYDVSSLYYESIRYCGPDWAQFLSQYYGYFSLSFNNLNLRLIEMRPDLNCIGLSSFPIIYSGILHLHMFYGGSPYPATAEPCYFTGAATVPTGFWSFYWDFGFLCFVPIIVALVLDNWFLCKANNEMGTIVWHVLYFWYASEWILMSFHNLLFDPGILYTGMLLYFVIKYSFVEGRPYDK